MRSQLLILPTLAGETASVLARGAWNGLSRAVHHYAYELPPQSSAAGTTMSAGSSASSKNRARY